MAWKMISENLTRPTTALINTFADMEKAPGDRDPRGWRSDFVRKLIEAGEFNGSIWASAYCKEQKKLYRVNGKHTSKVMQAMNGELRGKKFKVNVQSYECDTLADVAALYKTFDTRESVRIVSDINKSVSATIPGLEKCHPWLINLCVSAIDSVEAVKGGLQGEELKTHARSDPFARAERLREEVSFVLWTQDVLGARTKASMHLWRAPSVAAMYMTYQKSRAAATEFWTAVRNGECAAKEPAGLLERYLREVSVKSSGGKPGAGRREMAVKCIHAWNAWRKGEATSLRYLPNADFPKVK